MANKADISENQLILSYGEKVCMNLLKDHTTQQNIYWATDSYADYGEDFTFFAPITLDKITSYASKEGKVITKEQYNDLVKKNPEEIDKYYEIIRPRAVKSKEEQTQRAKDKAEVFTPAWICNAQNNLVDEEWFGRKDRLFNSPDPEDPQKWINNEEKIEFPEGKTWKDYVADTRLEITCGEAPYLCNRYDAVTGEYNEKVKYRIGILDRKLRIVSENTKDSKEWILWAKIALRATYGFEWQGDNLLLAREALFFTFEEHYIAQFGEKKFNQNKMRIMPGAAYIISWNVWQMDGLTYGLPGYEPYIEKKQEQDSEPLLFDCMDDWDEPAKDYEPKPQERFCLIKDFLKDINLQSATLRNIDFHDQSAIKLPFESLVNKDNNK